METPEIKGLTLQEMAAEAVKEALDDSGTDPAEIDAIFVGNVTMHTSTLPATYSQIAKWTGMQFKAGVHFDGACSTTNIGITLGAMGIASGVYRKVLVVGLESTLSQPRKLSPFDRETIPTEEMWLWTDYCVNQAYSVPQGYDIFPTYNGIIAQAYCKKYGISIEEFEKGMFELCSNQKASRLHEQKSHYTGDPGGRGKAIRVRRSVQILEIQLQSFPGMAVKTQKRRVGGGWRLGDRDQQRRGNQ